MDGQTLTTRPLGFDTWHENAVCLPRGGLGRCSPKTLPRAGSWPAGTARPSAADDPQIPVERPRARDSPGQGAACLRSKGVAAESGGVV